MGHAIDGRAIAAQILDEVSAEIRTLTARTGVVPGLAVILVGDDPASKTYVSSKAKMCSRLGMNSIVETLPASVSEAHVADVVRRFNDDAAIHGVLVQLPLPPHMSPDRIVECINPLKDVDGLHPANVGLLCAGRPRFTPCTPYGVCEMLLRSGVTTEGREVVVLGRSNLVGRPLSVLLSSKGRFGNATVTVCHSLSRDLVSICRRADVLIAAIGKRRFVTSDMVKPGAVVIDVGIHPAVAPGETMCGDVDYQGVIRVASLVSPVPGGVGKMTIAMLMRNTLDAAVRLSSA